MEPRLPWSRDPEPEQRPCIQEERFKTYVYDGSVVTLWIFHYSDGTKETVTKRERRA